MTGRGRQSARRAPGSSLRLPGFVTDEDIGLGNVVKRMTMRSAFGPAAVQQRAAALNSWVRFSGRRGR